MKIQVNRRNFGFIVLAILAFHVAMAFPYRLTALAVESMHMHWHETRQHATNVRYWDVLDLEARLLANGWPVEYVPGLMKNEHAYGATFHKMQMCSFFGECEEQEQKIVIDAGLSWDERYSVLLHEAAHTLQPERLTENQREVWAECVAALAAHDGLREHARYLAGLKADVWPTVLAYWTDMYRVADDLTR